MRQHIILTFFQTITILFVRSFSPQRVSSGIRYDADREECLSILRLEVIENNAKHLSKFPNVLSSLKNLESEIENNLEFSPVVDGGPDQEFWNALFSKSNWTRPNSLVIKAYFYRRIAQSVEYFQSNFDPFLKTKFGMLRSSLRYIEDLTARLPDIIDRDPDEALQICLQISLWGKSLELGAREKKSISSDDDFEESFSSKAPSKKLPLELILRKKELYVLEDDSVAILNRLDNIKIEKSVKGRNDVSIILGEVGANLVADLFLGYILLLLKYCDTVTYHTKSYPLYVSECTTDDVIGTIQYLCNPSVSDVWSVRHFGESLMMQIQSGKMKINDDLFWCQPTAFSDMPTSVRNKLSNSAMVFVKGDANYRRLLGDRMWALDHDAKEVLSYWTPIPVCALRTILSDIGCGISESNQYRATRVDSNWMKSGQWGMVQYNGIS